MFPLLKPLLGAALRTVSTGVLLFTPLLLPALTIEECYQKAEANYPLVRQYALVEKSAQYDLENASKAWLPQLNLSGKATYQSDVTKVALDFSKLGMPAVDLPTVSKDQYGVSLDVSQTLWDGGAVNAQKQAIRRSTEADRQQLNVNLYAVRERINSLYFGLLLLQEKMKQSALLQQELQRNISKIETYIANGMANESDLNAVKVDLLRSRQAEVQLRTSAAAYREMLGLFIGSPVSEEEPLLTPSAPAEGTTENRRPELALFSARIDALQGRNASISASLMPKVNLFVTGGYGKPGLNMLENSFKPYYIGGVRFSWNIGAFYTAPNARRKIAAGIAAVENERDLFLLNTSMQLSRLTKEELQYREQMRYDDEIIALRAEVKRAAEVKMANGTLSGMDLIRDINAEQTARLTKIEHELQRLLTLYNLKFTTNN